MKRRITHTCFALGMSLANSELAKASTKTLTNQNLSRGAISAIADFEKKNPELSVTAPLQNAIPANEFDDLSFDLANGACLHDISYVYGSGQTLLEENFDFCSTNVLIIK